MEDYDDQLTILKREVIEDVNSKFNDCPQCLFSEHDIHSVLYNTTISKLDRIGIGTKEKTKDKQITCLVHHEYPTPFRCDMGELSFRRTGERERTEKGGLYKRGHYDLVVLNRDFVKENVLDVVCGKDYEKLLDRLPRLSSVLLDWICEIIWFPSVKKIPGNAIEIIQQDALKVKETIDCNFSNLGSVHVFTNHDYRNVMDLSEEIEVLSRKLELEISFTYAR